MENELVLNEKDLAYAQSLCASIAESETRNRAVANVIAARVATNYFENEYNVDCETGLHNIPLIVGDIDMSDIYVNGSYIDVRVYFTSEEVCVPKLHFDLGITPDLYMFVKLSQDIKSGTVTGFIKPEDINKENSRNGYCYFKEDVLRDIDDVKSSIGKVDEEAVISHEQIYNYLDGFLTDDDKVTMLRNLIHSETARKSLIKAVKAQSIYKLVSVNKSLVEEPKQEEISNQEADVDDIDDLFVAEEDVESNPEDILTELEYSTDVTPSGAQIIEDLDNDEAESANNENSEQINTLFNDEQQSTQVPKKKKSNKFLLFVLLLTLICAGGYLLYTNVYTQNSDNSIDSLPMQPVEENVDEPAPAQNVSEAMPIETVSSVKNSKESKEEANSVSIPAIERNLDASVLVSNLKIDWEVPSGYASNTAARRYLVKMGKRIQLDLKAELLLLTKPPISNRISVELQYDNKNGKFQLLGIKDSSGEKSVDDVILNTVRSILETSPNAANDGFAKLQGNPILIIRL